MHIGLNFNKKKYLNNRANHENLDLSRFLSLRIFRLLSASLLLFPQSFGRYVLWPSSGVCRTREPTRNFELRPLLCPRYAMCRGEKYLTFVPGYGYADSVMDVVRSCV